ncbi:hypothetical protein GO013_11560 [Pseudodesulfovibrio sp. JC047]|nr:hypothetical protein [Pseudodesulfovibrio sp. JC047]
MSFGKINEYAALIRGQGRTGEPSGTTDGARDTCLQAAFDSQMTMAQSLFGAGNDASETGGASETFDVSMIQDASMLDALATITRLMRPEAVVSQQSGQGNDVGEKETAERDVSLSPVYVPGSLSAHFESGKEGVSAIGYDRVGGTSYGKYQIASKPGTMDRFLTYLDANASDVSERLRAAGPTNTGSKDGGMPQEWRAIAAESPVRFETLQHDFIAGETYQPARNMILQQTGLDFENAPPALREVLWSTSVQHGPTGAARIFNTAIDSVTKGGQKVEFNASLIEGVYDNRKGQFGSSSKRVQQSVVSRLDSEKQLALNLLGRTQLNQIV